MTPPLVLLHGFLGSPRAWDPVVTRVRDAFPRVPWLAPNLPGHGTGASRPPSTWRDTVDAIAALMPAGPSIVAGYSLGGRLALGLLAQHPSRVAGLVLVSTHLGIAHPGERARRADEDAALATLAEERGIDALVRAHAARPVLASQSALPEAQRTMLEARRRAHDADSVAASLRAVGLGAMPDLRSALREASARGMPVEALAGERDPAYVSLCREAATLAHGAATVVAGCGHDLLLEAPDCVELAIQAALRAQISTGHEPSQTGAS